MPWAKKSSADEKLKAGRRSTWPSSIMYIENRGQHTSLNAFYKLVTLFDISVDEFFYPDKLGGESERRKHIDRMLNGMDEKELIIIEGAAEGIRKARETEGA